MTIMKTHPYNPPITSDTNNKDTTYTTDCIPINDFPENSNNHHHELISPADNNHHHELISPAEESSATIIPEATLASPSPECCPSPKVENGPGYVKVVCRKPVMLTYCPHCHHEHVRTDVKTKATGTTWVCVMGGFFLFWPLCWIPLVIDECQQTNHYCSNCGTKVGRVKPLS